MKKHYNITIHGNVVNVGFRFYAMERAYKDKVMGLAKYIKNNVIYIEAEGEDEQLQSFLVWCKKGPIGSIVEKVDVIEDENLINYDSFEIISSKIIPKRTET